MIMTTVFPKQYFILYGNNIPVKGASRSIICDLQRAMLYFIPNILFEILTEHKHQKLIEIYKLCEGEEDILEEYYSFLVDKELGFYTDEPELFPIIEMDWKTPSLITNSILDINERSNHNFKQYFLQLDELGCRAIQIRILHILTPELIPTILDYADDTRIQSIEFLLKYDSYMDTDFFENLGKKYSRLHYIGVYSSPFEKLYVSPKIFVTVNYVSTVLEIGDSCGKITPSNFVINIPMFTESQKYNTCLNKKISIDTDGNVKNCPSCTKSFGLFGQNNLIDIISHNTFQKMWNISKDEIEVCKDCEFRYICTDCRVNITDKNNILSKPLMCNYNPYTATWE